MRRRLSPPALLGASCSEQGLGNRRWPDYGERTFPGENRRHRVDSFEWNKIAGWILAAAIAVLGLSIVTGMIFAPHGAEQKGYVVEGVELEAEAGGVAAEAEKPIAFFLASADVAKGENAFKKCAACHTITPGGANGIGPNLHGT